ncbi:MAG: hypothetical protein ACREI7_11595, partial [Myxococcota bacterium]
AVVLDRYGDERDLVAKAALERGKCLEKLARPKEAEAAYRLVVDKYADEPVPAIAAYDALALQALAQGRPDGAETWVEACANRYEKRAARGDRYGAFLSRLLGEMKAPGELATFQSRDR